MGNADKVFSQECAEGVHGFRLFEESRPGGLSHLVSQFDTIELLIRFPKRKPQVILIDSKKANMTRHESTILYDEFRAARRLTIALMTIHPPRM